VQGPSDAPTVLAFDRMPSGYFRSLAEEYRVVVLDYPPRDVSQDFVDSFTADHVCAEILAVADAVGATRFAWFGFSWGAVVGLQLAVRTNRLTALACGGWPPLGGQYEETLAVTEAGAARGGDKHYLTYYRSLRNWPERDAVSKITCPRLVFAGTNDQFVAEGHSIRIGPLVSEHRNELERLGWTVRLVDGFGHELGARPDVVIPLLRDFLAPVLRRA
jgi:pimeloyl-ACP methyl ester carboxylesterase